MTFVNLAVHSSYQIKAQSEYDIIKIGQNCDWISI